MDALQLPATAGDEPAAEDARPGYIPEGFDSADDFLKDMREKRNADYEAAKDNRKAAVDDKMFWNGKQWTDAALKYRKNLPVVTINPLKQYTSQITGDWRVNRPSIRVLPSEDGDVDTAEIRADLIRAIEAQSRADRAYDNAFESMVICGDGAFRVSVDYAHEDVFDQDIVIKPVDDVQSTLWDRMSIDQTGKDARHCFVDDLMPRTEFERKWPGKEPSQLGPRDAAALDAEGWCTPETVRVTEYWRMIERDRELALFADGSILDTSDKGYADAVKERGEPVRRRVSKVRYAQMHLVTGHAILAGPFEYRLTRLPIIRMLGRVITIEGRREISGMVREMKEPLRLRNYWRSKAAEYLGYATKAKYKAAASAVEGREAAWRNSHLNDDTLLIFNDNASGAPQEVSPPQLPAALMTAAQENTQDLKDVSGLHDASLGMRSNETSGVAIMARQREGDVANVVFHDSGNAALLEAGDVVNQLIGQVIDGTRTLRVIGEDQAVRMVRANDPSFVPGKEVDRAVDLSNGRYDVMLSTGPSYTTRRVEGAQAMEKLIQGNPELSGVIGDLYIKMLDVPGADKMMERIQRTMPPELIAEEGEDPVPPQVKAQMEQMGQVLEALKAENDNLKTDRSLEERKLDIDAYGKETDRIKAVTGKDFPLGPESAQALQMIVAQAVRDALASPDILQPQEPAPPEVPMDAAMMMPQEMAAEPMMMEPGPMPEEPQIGVI